jgi:hypothetical protein
MGTDMCMGIKRFELRTDIHRGIEIGSSISGGAVVYSDWICKQLDNGSFWPVVRSLESGE